MLGFRSYFAAHDHRDNLHTLTREQLDRWMTDWKGWDPAALRADRWVTIGDGVRGLLLHHAGQDGSESERVRIVESKSEEQWVTQVTMHTPSSRDRTAWAWIDVEAPDQDAATGHARRTRAGTPRFIAPLLDVVDAWDGSVRLTTRPVIIRGSEVNEVYQALLDRDRRGFVFVAGNDDTLPLVPWTDLIAKLTRFTHGVAACYVLDGEATRLINERLGPVHAVPAGTLRSFRPDVKPHDMVDALRHRVLSTERIIDDREHNSLARILASSAHAQALEQPLPTPATRVHRMLERLADELLVHRLGDGTRRIASLEAPATIQTRVEAQQTEQAAPDDRSALLLEYLRLKLELPEINVDAIDEMADWIGIGKESLEAKADVASRLSQLQTDLDEVTAVNAALVRRLEDEQLENRDALDGLTRSEETVRALRRRLAETGHGDIAWTEQPAEEHVSRPGSFGELLRWLPRLKYVVFTGDPDCAIDLDDIDTLGSWASKTWDALLALNDYGMAKADGRWGRDLHGFLQHTPDGCHVWSVNRYAYDESEDVKNNTAFRKARTLTVPESVHPSGRVFMGAHFKITQSGMTSPRVHCHDDTAGGGLIYVGYIGRHLPTKQTN
ncbi:hypothetical protein BJY16_002488 [Actinoplanes octamycinicus]|uniref:Uncharacterized protein n=1 Tax=Actinoplanes octamycinicus TaxID=135948 RepID=A0A7W7GVG1_9ACTN|nr:hypothetical protein [Actinoplanes octamycinicus]MBB4739029.1 hypothetical protein [Actinoplanes octamycinicus]GIE60158.1 hypothetical protein Aoc01nite_55600 [Actinoplanes octamycinicus]